MEVTLKELLHAINIFGVDTDVTVDGYGTIAVSPPVRFTPAGLRHFEQALTANVNVDYDGNEHNGTYVCDDDDKINEMAMSILTFLAGYCYADGYDAWFEGENAEII